jgi:hypothetical protein
VDRFSRESGGDMNAVASMDLVREVVTSHRRAGSKIEVAFLDAAVALGVTPRWVRAVVRGEPAIVKPGRVAALRAGFAAWLAADIERTEKLIAERRAMLAKMEDGHADAMAAGQGDLFLASGANGVARVACQVGKRCGHVG